ncbi:MAG: protein-export chaperone SecB [Alphaproteobacteria bacterium]
MSETETNGTTEAEGQKTGVSGIVVNAQYLRDLSFENPNAPQSITMMQQNPPQIAIDMNVRHRQLEGRTYESVLTIKASAKSEENVIFLVECDYAGVVTLGDEIPDEAIHPVLVVEVSRLVFPFARKVISDSVQEGGFPPLLVNPIDFRQLLQKAPDVATQEPAGNA